MVRCTSTTTWPAVRMEWLTDQGQVVQSATSMQQINLVFSPVNDSIHNQVYICRVVIVGDLLATQNFTVHVNGETEIGRMIT